MHAGRVIALGSPNELKDSLGKGHLLHLESSDLLGSMTALQDHSGILDVAVFGSGLHVTVEDQDVAMRAITSTLHDAGIKVWSLDPIPPSMEDVFVSLIEREERLARR
jgi:ABC-2 type transport system ATP-binding protein